MEILERIWELIGVFFSGLLRGFERGMTAVFGSSNARYIRRMQSRVEAINRLEPKYQVMSERGVGGTDREVPRAAGCGRDAGRSAGRSLRRLSRGGPPLSRTCGITTCR